MVFKRGLISFTAALAIANAARADGTTPDAGAGLGFVVLQPDVLDDTGAETCAKGLALLDRQLPGSQPFEIHVPIDAGAGISQGAWVEIWPQPPASDCKARPPPGSQDDQTYTLALEPSADTKTLVALAPPLQMDQPFCIALVHQPSTWCIDQIQGQIVEAVKSSPELAKSLKEPVSRALKEAANVQDRTTVCQRLKRVDGLDTALQEALQTLAPSRDRSETTLLGQRIAQGIGQRLSSQCEQMDQQTRDQTFRMLLEPQSDRIPDASKIKARVNAGLSFVKDRAEMDAAIDQLVGTPTAETCPQVLASGKLTTSGRIQIRPESGVTVEGLRMLVADSIRSTCSEKDPADAKTGGPQTSVETQFQAPVEQALPDIVKHAVEVSTLTQAAGGNQTRAAANFVSVNAGVVAAVDGNMEVVPYVGVNLYAGAVERQISIWRQVPALLDPDTTSAPKFFRRHLSLTIGVALANLHPPGVTASPGVLAKKDLLVGLGFRISDYALINLGAVIYSAPSPNPASGDQQVRAAPFLGTSVDFDIVYIVQAAFSDAGLKSFLSF